MEQGKAYILCNYSCTYILFGESFIGYVKVPLYSVCFSLNHGKTK